MLDYSKLQLKNNFIYYNDKKMKEEILNGYVYVKDNIEEKKYRKHRLVWEIYNKKKIPNGMVINHLDGNKLNNNPLNLEVTTIQGNTKHWSDNLSNKDLLENFNGRNVYAYNVYVQEEMFFKTIAEAEKTLKISGKLIASVLSGKQKTTKEHIFSYTPINNISKYIKDNIDFDKIENYKDKIIIATYPNGDVKMFQNTRDAAKFFNTKTSNILRWIRKERNNKDNITFISL